MNTEQQDTTVHACSFYPPFFSFREENKITCQKSVAGGTRCSQERFKCWDAFNTTNNGFVIQSSTFVGEVGEGDWNPPTVETHLAAIWS